MGMPNKLGLTQPKSSTVPTSIRPDDPTLQGIQGPQDPQGPEDALVVTGQPQRQVDVEIGFALLGVPGSQVGQGAAHAVEDQHQAFAQDHQAADADPGPTTGVGAPGDGGDAGDHKGPDEGVGEFDEGEGVHGVGWERRGGTSGRGRYLI